MTDRMSRDIIMAFCNYFRFINPGGLYIVEDLHCSYWPRYGGGIVCASSAMNFFKLICDMVNHDYWKNEIAAESLLTTFFSGSNFPKFSLFADIFSITFVNSMCIIEKRGADQSPNIGARVIVGNDAQVVPEIVTLREKLVSS